MAKVKILVTIILFTFSIFIFSTSKLFSQESEIKPPDIQWEKTYGDKNDDWAYSIKQITDGGFILAGTIDSRLGKSAGSDLYILKLDNEGNKIWDKRYGGNKGAGARRIEQTTDGGYIVAGGMSHPGKKYGCWYILKVDSNGNKVWDKSFGGTKGDDSVCDIKQTKDSGYIVVGNMVTSVTSSEFGDRNFYIIKLDNKGNKVWEKSYGGKEFDTALSVQQTTDGSYIVAGETDSFGAGNADFYVIKLNGKGDKIWAKTYGGNKSEAATCILQTKDNGYIVGGDINYMDGKNSDFYIIKLDAKGNKIWAKIYGTPVFDNLMEMQQTKDNGYIIGGITNGSQQNSNFYVIKLDGKGNKMWEQTYGGDKGEQGYSIIQTSDDGYVITGLTSSFGAGGDDIYIIKLAPEN